MSTKKTSPPTTQTFVEHFVEQGDAAAAAIAAGATPEQAAVQAATLLADPAVQQALGQMATLEGVSEGEAKVRLSHWARGSVAHFLRIEGSQVVIDLSTEEAQRHYHLLHRVVERRYTIQTEQGPAEVVETEIEMYDAIEATHRILQLHGAYPPVKYDLTTNGHDLPAPVIATPN
jgi:phage terminase small subunit